MAVKYSFIGVGNIASAIISSLSTLEGKLKTAPSDIFLYDKNPIQSQRYADVGYSICATIEECIDNADYIFLCVKPQNYREVLEYLRSLGRMDDNKVIVSVAAGIATSQICECIGQNIGVIRTMPNTPMMIGQGVCAICHNEYVKPKQFEMICRIFSAKAELMVLDESMMNKIIGITSSSPAYVYKFIDALNEAAIAEGFDDPKMLSVICKMIIGSALMVLEKNSDIKQLIKAVKSPNGTTEKALEVFDKEDLEGMVLRAVIACNKRADTLGSEM